MKENGGSVVGTKGTEFWPERCNVPVTRKGDTLYFHYDWLQASDIVCDKIAKPKSVMAKGVAIPHEWKDGRLTIRLPYTMLDNLTTVVEVRQ